MLGLLNSVRGINYSRGTSVCSDVVFSKCAWQLWANERLKFGACISAYALCLYMKGTHTVSDRQIVRNNVNIQLHGFLSFCFRLWKTGWESWKTLQSAFNVNCHNWYDWGSYFKSGRRSLEDDPHQGRRFTSHTDKTVTCECEIIHAEQRLIIRKVTFYVRI